MSELKNIGRGDDTRDNRAAAHTPGPWDWDTSKWPINGSFHFYIVDATKRKIAALWGKAAEKEANARLIVAAPDMLAALQSCLQVIEYTMRAHPEVTGLLATQRAQHSARAAIAKATEPPHD